MTAERATRDPRRVRAPSDPEILARLAKGELDALGELYDRHQPSVRRFVARVTSDAEDVDDIVHRTFLTAAKAAARYDGRTSSRPWLLGIAARLLRQRRSALGRLFEVLASLRRTRPRSIDPRATLDLRQDIQAGLARLSEPKRITLLLAEVEGLSCAEIAETLEVPIGTVWTRLHAARSELRVLFEAKHEVPR